MITPHPLPIGADRITTGDEIVVASRFDGHEVGRVPACGPAEVGHDFPSPWILLPGGSRSRTFVIEVAAAIGILRSGVVNPAVNQFGVTGRMRGTRTAAQGAGDEPDGPDGQS